MPLLNYTTQIAVSKSMAQVQTLLVAAGATAVMATYDQGRAVGMTFSIKTDSGMRTFELPVDANKAQAVLKRQRVAPKYSTLEQAERIAWRIIKDWIEAQLAMLSTEMVTLDQIMLPYMHADNGMTVYELYRDRTPALPSGD